MTKKIFNKKMKFIYENGVKVYKDYYCKCGCERRIPYPKSPQGVYNHRKRTGIPEYVTGHNSAYKRSKEVRNNMSIARMGWEYSEKTKKKISKTLTGQHFHSEEFKEMKRKAFTGENNPKYVDGHGAWRKNFVTHSISRGYGYAELNKPFKGSTGHHIDRDCGIYIPREIHRSIPHRLNNPESMKLINDIAFEFLGYQHMLMYGYEIEDEELINKEAIKHIFNLYFPKIYKLCYLKYGLEE